MGLKRRFLVLADSVKLRGSGEAALPVTPSASWFPRLSGHQLMQQTGSNFPKTQCSSPNRLLRTQSWCSSFTWLCWQLQIWISALACSYYYRKPDSVYSPIAWSQRCSRCQSVVPASHMQWPCPLVMWPTQCLGLRSIRGASDPSPERLSIMQREAGQDASKFPCASLHTGKGLRETAWPSGTMSAQTCILLLFHFWLLFWWHSLLPKWF